MDSRKTNMHGPKGKGDGARPDGNTFHQQDSFVLLMPSCLGMNTVRSFEVRIMRWIRELFQSQMTRWNTESGSQIISCVNHERGKWASSLGLGLGHHAEITSRPTS